MTRQFYIIVFTIGILLLGGGVYFASQVGAQSAPAIPSDFNVEAVSSCKFKISWTYGDVEGIVFEANRKKGSGGAYFESIPDIKGSYYFTDSNKDTLWEGEDNTIPIDPEKNYSYQLRAFDGRAYSNYTDFAEATTEPLPGKPGKPVDIGLDARENGGKAYVSWQVNSPISDLFSEYGKFEIWHATSSDGENYSDLEYLDEIPSSHYEEVGGEEKYFYDYPVDRDLSHKYVIYTREVGGEDCDPDREQHTVLSDGSKPVVLPARPYELGTESFEQPERKIKLTWNDRSAETEFEIQRSLTSSFDSPEPYSVVNADQTEYNDTNITETEPETYWYRIRSCIDNNCSFFTKPVSGTVGVPVPQNVKARIVYVSGEKSGGAEVNLSWEEEIIHSDSKLRIEKAVGEGDFDEEVAVIPTLVPARDKSNYTFTEPSLGGTYRYRIVKIAFNGTESDPSDPPAVINLDTSRILQGVAWTAGEDSEGNLHGIGWVKFNSLKENGTGSTNNLYSVQIHDDGVLSGLAWAGEKYGWLSFNKADLGGCPTGTGTCEAQIDSNGKLNGWARFLSPLKSEGNGNWNGWVKLRGTTQDGNDYGVSFDSDTGEFSGAAWGGDVAGWIVFGGSDCSDCTVRAMVNTCDPIDLSATAESSNEIRIDWTNADYECEDGISLYRISAYQPGVDRNQFSEEAVFPSGSHHSGFGGVSYTDGGLEKDTTYAYFVKESALGNESNIGWAKTPKADYDITCQARSSNEINVFWNGDVISGYDLKLLKANTKDVIYDIPGTGDGNYVHDNGGVGLEPDTRYGYELGIYKGGNREADIEPDYQPVYCTTAAVSSDMPTELSVLPLSSSTLHVTWKDNAAVAHNFELERIKLTPDAPGQLEVAAGGSSIDLNWANTTNDNTHKGPFYHVVERTEDTDGNGDPDFGGSSFTASTEAGSTDYYNTATDFSFIDSEASGGTYYYRVKACSYIKADVDGDGSLESDCSDYSSVESDTVAAGKKKNWYGNIIEAIKSFFSSLRDKSESIIERMETASAAGIDIDKYFTQFEEYLLFENHPGVYDDPKLDADSAYLYRVKAVPTSGSPDSAYSLMGAGKTLSAGKETPVKINICTGNSFCEPFMGTETDGGDRDLQNQCRNHAGCRDVGTSRKVFEETK